MVIEIFRNITSVSLGTDLDICILAIQPYSLWIQPANKASLYPNMLSSGSKNPALQQLKS